MSGEKKRPNYHPAILDALKRKDLDKICEHLHTHNYESDIELACTPGNEVYVVDTAKKVIKKYKGES